MFNLKEKEDKQQDCNNNEVVYQGDVSYIDMVKWCDFIKWINYYITKAENKKENARDIYDIKTNMQ